MDANSITLNLSATTADNSQGHFLPAPTDLGAVGSGLKPARPPQFTQDHLNAARKRPFSRR